MLGWFRRFRLPPPLLVLFRVLRPPLFFFLALSGFARFGPGVSVLVFALSLLFCVPLLGSWLSNSSSHFHSHLIFIPPFILTFISSARTPPCQRQGVCVKRLKRRKTSSYYIIFNLEAGGHRGLGGVGDQRRHLPGTRENVPAGLWWCTWAHLSRSWWPP